MSNMMSLMLVCMAHSGERDERKGDCIDELHVVVLVDGRLDLFLEESDEINSRKLSEQSMLEKGRTEMNVYCVKQ